jgi:hypothetical protein
MTSQPKPVGCNALPPKAAAIKLEEDITSAGVGSLVNDNNKMLAGKMSQTKTSESRTGFDGAGERARGVLNNSP